MAHAVAVLVPTSLSNLRVRVRCDDHDTVVVAGDAWLVSQLEFSPKGQVFGLIGDLMW